MPEEQGISQGGGGAPTIYTLGTVFVEQKESHCAQSKGFALCTAAQRPSWCLAPPILGSQSDIALHWSWN